MEFLRKYGIATTIYAPLIKAGSNDQALAADYTHTAGDTTVVKDGGTAANITTAPSAITMGNGATWKFSLSATEMQAAEIVINLSDSATKAVEDQQLVISTYGNASAEHAVDLDDPVRAGLTALPNAAAGAAGGLPTDSTGKTSFNDPTANSVRDAILNAAIASYLTSGSVGLYIAIAGGVIVDATVTGTPTATEIQFSGGSTTANFYQDKSAYIITGTAVGQAIPILSSSYSGGTTTLTFDENWAVPAVAGDRLLITIKHEHPVTQIRDSITAALNNLSQADIRTAVGLAAANLDTQIATLALASVCTEARLSELDAATAGKMANQVDIIQTDTTTDIPALIAALNDIAAADVWAAATRTLTANTNLNDPTAAAIAAAMYAYDMGNGRTIGEALAFLRNKWEITGSPATLTVYDTDDTTVLWTSALLRTAGDPVYTSDPV